MEDYFNKRLGNIDRLTKENVALKAENKRYRELLKLECACDEYQNCKVCEPRLNPKEDVCQNGK